MDKNILGRWLKIETASQSQYITKSIHNKQRLSTSGIGHPVPRKGRPPQAIPSSISRHIITCYVRQGSKYTVIYIYIYMNTLVQTIASAHAKLEVVRRKHIVHLTGFGAHSSTCCKATDNCAGTLRVVQLPSSRSGCRHSTMPARTHALRAILPP